MSEPILKTPLEFVSHKVGNLDYGFLRDAAGMTVASGIHRAEANAIISRCNAYDQMREELIESLGDTFYEIASKDDDGWYCTNARSTAVYAAERLVELGHFEGNPKNEPKSRVKWFRPAAELAVAMLAELGEAEAEK